MPKELTVFGAVSPFVAREIVHRGNVDDHLNSVIVSSDIHNDGVTTDILPIDLSGVKSCRMISVAPGTNVPEHSHITPIVRLITGGDLTVNDVQYGPGDWMIIPSDFPYQVSTQGGYTAVGFCHLWSSNVMGERPVLPEGVRRID